MVSTILKRKQHVPTYNNDDEVHRFNLYLITKIIFFAAKIKLIRAKVPN